MNTRILARRTYEAPDTSVDWIELEQTILSDVRTKQLTDMELYEMYDEDF